MSLVNLGGLLNKGHKFNGLDIKRVYFGWVPSQLTGDRG